MQFTHESPLAWYFTGVYIIKWSLTHEVYTTTLWDEFSLKSKIQRKITESSGSILGHGEIKLTVHNWEQQCLRSSICFFEEMHVCSTLHSWRTESYNTHTDTLWAIASRALQDSLSQALKCYVHMQEWLNVIEWTFMSWMDFYKLLAKRYLLLFNFFFSCYYIQTWRLRYYITHKNRHIKFPYEMEQQTAH